MSGRAVVFVIALMTRCAPLPCFVIRFWIDEENPLRIAIVSSLLFMILVLGPRRTFN